MSISHNIAVLPGDGIGPEVMRQAMNVLAHIQALDPSLDLNFDIFEWNSEYYLEHGEIMPKNGLEVLQSYDAILFGAIGDPRVPDEVTIWQLIMPIRKQFQQYINFRPVKLLKGVKSPLAKVSDIDFVIIRENAEGEYSNSGGRLYQGQLDEIGIQNTVLTLKGTQKAAQFAFEYAVRHKLNTVTSATKSNAILHTMELWDEVIEVVSCDYPAIKLNSYYIDALAAFFVSKPQEFEVIIASNLFGDILSDLGSAVVGGLGLSPSANLNPERNFPSMFEPVHGSAPDIAGLGVANPIAQIWSAALMLEHLGRPELSSLIVRAIESVLQNGSALTPDLGGTSTTNELGDAICLAITRSFRAASKKK
ncbi:Tartrate dehydrogenase/decarboxylase [Vibrio nigripulchritudo SFn27]|uniref:D-malate dehydrogenase (decarboxylating) n=1 Tax=Vibrio nigripulchritudo TaxID=28173 RepID=U4K389_9VIBR|nr:tartrate dehydrogenase [Vibrio nigripulchritudo]CCN83818.1 Tartrate dehydrogenase/decarboxylase [Vibrio nigripulchritudo BLFn1]CCN87174.1 Tartrate dehydrogenase/decarboxylase [Vibrio nigripulchritudo SFn27]CCN94530.1 Tartrate dehydrogenase/decarboxylase [Vibrio nigripulchritudo ENn2]CCO40904.1 Tartrate dehydrogenase/decarboxylase [Vibrio nigripulchritudo SFn135]CCO54983.1 Tartrate dehydrogenase/decarboxylase [Vibrio nigripulchritudo Wn13]